MQKETSQYEKKSDEAGYMYFRHVRPEYNSNGKSPGIIGSHIHIALEIKIVTKGSMVAHIMGKKYTLNAGDIAFIDSLVPHYYNNLSKDVWENVLVFDINFFRNVCPDGYTFPCIMRKNKAFPLIEEIISRTWDEEWSTMPYHKRKGFVYSLLGTLVEYYDLIEKHKTGDEVFLKAMSFIEENYKLDLTIDFLSDKFGYSKTYFSNKLHKITNMNFKDYLNRIRISAALNIKRENPKMPMYMIAEKVGFKSWNTFDRAFKKFVIME